MNKEKFINKLNEELDELKGKELLYFNMRDSVQEARCTNRIFGIQYALNCARLLDEPQKVKVPAFVAPFIEKLKITNSRYGVELEKAYNNEEDEELVNWLWFNENVLTLFRALEKGYEVEEEPKWKIINDQKYCLTSIEAGYGNSLHWAFDSTKKKPILFDNEETALYTAYITGGKVEKV